MKITTILLLITICLFGCSIELLLPEGCITVLVIDEHGKPLEGVNVGIGFEKNTGSGTKGIPVRGVTDATGKFTGKHNTLPVVQYRAYKDGYYESSGEYRFKSEAAKKWQPWNPEIKLVLRKIENPVPMYARNLSIQIPALDKAIAFDLIKCDWVPPYGKGEHPDIVFKLNKYFISRDNFDAKLYVTFTNKYDGIIKISESIKQGSKFKLPRYAPETGYIDSLTIQQSRTKQGFVKYDYDENNNYIFRIRSEVKDGKIVRAMFGKIIGDVKFDPMNNIKLADIVFKFYLNPDYSHNLEFDSKRNLFTNLKSTETIGLD
ncbi:MAG: hypothetical protein FD174_886 [Geobacteraceae bacterium]|nr:MAG: hypothetical protein FD174_886 [Geobacteraceae bacterium]